MQFRMMLATVAVAGALACGGDETGPSHSTVESVRIVVGDNPLPVSVGGTINLDAGTSVVLEVQFLDEGGDLVTGIESSHYASLTFNPASLATSADVAGHHFEKTVTAQATAGAGTVMVGYGHDAAADEHSFGPFNVVVQ